MVHLQQPEERWVSIIATLLRMKGEGPHFHGSAGQSDGFHAGGKK